MNQRILAVIIVSLFLLPIASAQFTDYEDYGEVEDSVTIGVPTGTVGFSQAYLIQLPREDHTWEDVTLESDALLAPSDIWDVDVSPDEEIFFTEQADLDVSSIDPGQYALFVYICNTGPVPECRWMKPQVFSLSIPAEDLETTITSPSTTDWYNDDLTLQIDETNVPSLSCSYSIDTNGDASFEETGTRGCDEPFDIAIGSGELCNTLGTGTCSIQLSIENSDGDTATTSAAFNVDYQDPSISVDPSTVGSTAGITVDVSSSYSPLNQCRVDWQDDGSYEDTFTLSGQSSTFEQSHTYGSGGEKTIRVSCADTADNIAHNTKTITVVGDFSTTITSPDADSWHKDDFTALVQDNYDVDDVSCDYRLDYDGSSWDTGWQNRECGNERIIDAGPGSDCSTQGDNMCRLQTRMQDDDGHVTTDIREFNIDYEAPPVDLVFDAAGLDVDAEVSAGPTHSRIDTCRIDWNNDPPYDETWTVNSQVDTETRSHTYASAGTYTVLANCTDTAGNSASNTESISVPLDPDLDTTIDTEADQWFRNSFHIDVNDEGTAAGPTCEYRVDDGDDGSWDASWQTRTCDSNQQITVSSGSQCSSQGTDSCRVQVRLEDTNGNEATAQKVFNIDYTQPDVSVAPDPISEMEIEAGVLTNSDYSPITECKLDWHNDPPFDVTRDFDSFDVSTTEPHEYTSEGTHTVLLRCTDAAGNSRDDTGDLNLPHNEPLSYDILNDPVSGTITDQDAFMAEVEVDTNAETIIWELAGEDYELTHDGSTTYNTLIDITGLTGTYDVTLRFEKDGEVEENAPYKTMTFADTPPRPDLNLDITDENTGVEAIVQTNYDQSTEVTLEIEIEDVDDNVRYTDTKTITGCDDSCSTTVDQDVTADETITVDASQSLYGLTSDSTTRTVTVDAVPQIHDTGFVGPTDSEVATTGEWRADAIAIMATAFAFEDIENAWIEDEEGSTVGDTIVFGNKLPAYIIDYGIIEIDDSVGNPIAGFNATLQPSEIDNNEDLTFKVELSSGETISHDLTTIEKVFNPPEPSVSSIGLSGTVSNQVTVRIQFNDQYHDTVRYELRDSNGDVRASGTDAPANDNNNVEVTLDSLPTDNGMSNIEVWAENPAGETTTQTKDALIDPDDLLKPFEINGDPQEKINIILYGHRYNMQELETSVAPTAVDFFFEDGDLASTHGSYRDHFNWYLIDSDEELCPYDIDDADGCDFLSDNIGIFESGSTIKGGNAGIAILSDQYFRSWAWSSTGFSMTSFGDGSTFAHELGHQVWGFDDEYNGDNGQYWGRSIHLFPEHDAYNKDSYPNTWPTESECQDAVNANYSTVSPSDCDKIVGNEPIWRIRQGDGPSLMEASSSPAEYYPTHETRVTYLMDNNPYYNGN